MDKEPCIVSWSGGKDSAYALHKVFQEGDLSPEGLLTNLHGDHRRVSMHGIREELLDEQAQKIGLPLSKMYITEETHGEYEKKLRSTLEEAKSQGIQKVVFGDIFLTDLREYREQQLLEVGMEGVFPIWGMGTVEIVEDVVRSGIKTMICSLQEDKLDTKWLGRYLDEEFLIDIPADVDPCGENGEFHTFVTNAPYFSSSVNVRTGDSVRKEFPDPQQKGRTMGFWYIDIQRED